MYQTAQIISYALKKLNIKSSSSKTENELLSHPTFPSLAAFQDTLALWKVQSMAVRLPPEQLSEIPYPAIGHVQTPQDDFIVLEKYNADQITYFEPSQGEITESVQGFTQKWSGNTLLLATNEHSGEVNYIQSRQKEHLQYLRKVMLGSLSLVLLILMGILITSHTSVFLFYLFKLMGLSFSLALLSQDLNITVNWIEKACKVHQKTSCDSVLQSPAAKITSWLSMTDVGFIYFGGTLVCCFLGILSGNSGETLGLIVLINAIALPYTIFSIYYQGVIIKQWCVLCLGVQVILWLEFVVGWFTGAWIHVSSISPVAMLYFLGGNAFAIALLIGFKPLLNEIQKNKTAQMNLLRLKKNRDIFKQILQLQPPLKIPLLQSDYQHIQKKIPIHFILILNPFCGPCAGFYKQIKHLKDNYMPDSQLDIVFLGSLNKDHLAHQVVNQLLSLQATEPDQFLQSLDDWFDWGKANHKAWLGKYDSNEADSYTNLQKEHLDWIQQNQIHKTPTLFVNGHELPPEYEVQDLKYHIQILEENLITTKS